MRTIRTCLAIGVALTVMMSGRALAQEMIEISGTMNFRAEGMTGGTSLTYGVGTMYTDTTDEADIEVPPFNPPGASFRAWFNRTCDGEFAGEPCQWITDYRALPDSALQSEDGRFAITYNVGVYNNTGRTMRIAILNPDWSPNVDSIYVRDAQGAQFFQHTFTGPGEIPMTDPNTTRLTVTVYYTLQVSSVDHEDDRSSATTPLLAIYPNPTKQREVSLTGIFGSGDRIAIVDMLGRVVDELEVGMTRDRILVTLPVGMAAGAYVMTTTSKAGKRIATATLHVVR